VSLTASAPMPIDDKKVHSDWPELLADMFKEMTKHDTVIEFDDMMVWVPVTTGEDTPHAWYKLKGKMRIHSARD